MADASHDSTWRIELLTHHHERGSFASGQPVLDDFLRHRAGQYGRRDVGRTYVLVAASDVQVVGYYTLAAGAMGFSTIPDEWAKRLPPHYIPTVHLGRLAVDKRVQGLGLGGDLLFHGLQTAVRVSDEIGVYAVDVFAVDESAKSFYGRFGFLQLRDDPFHLLIPVKHVREFV